ncbi:NAD-dependent epimerase/dehydratase family protein [Ktedonospora formicarum]|uniref:dTDP-glucose 4,6-dehydratase n=1 Tax=Ktedonospora formicarum TaxID=2778364 RepID=A0A8J3IB05_9CHLR|nr:NAD(P)-dependent oxidoreductase [Ktedonospora formicarum]GHO49327.1 dTDP-glucose 4,6-dehydratase [Ktedonospora formicarum]
MKIVVAGATGIIGRRLVPLLIAAGHEVYGTTRTAEKGQALQQAGASPLVIDMYDREGLSKVMREIQPEMVIHQLTDLSSFDYAANVRLRKEGTRNLVDAAKGAGVRRMIAQSISWVTAPGEGPADENVPLDLEAPLPRLRTIEGVQALESAVAEMEQPLVLRYGLLYGPDTWYARDGVIAEQVRRGEVVASKEVTSFLHIDDAARAALLALDWPQGIVNIVDDEPATGKVWLPIYAAVLGAPEPPTSDEKPRGMRGASNAKARQQLRWQPEYPSWREGFARSLQS